MNSVESPQLDGWVETMSNIRSTNTVDVTLVKLNGEEVPMPSGFDSFTALADRDYSDCTDEAAANAKLLETIMEANGFQGYQKEWWHYTDTDSYPVEDLLGSSLPVGGSGTHAVLSGHSGMAGQKMFTDLLQMKTGDIFYLHVLGETLAYEVDSLNTVLPHDTSLLGITDGSDLCTLITCTPIAVNSHRLLVTGHRIPFEAAKEMVEEAQQEDTEVESTWEQEYLRGLYTAIAVVLILFLICIVVALLGRNNDA